MKRIFVPTRSGSDWQRLLAKPTLHWKMGASAMTAAAAWEGAAGDLPSELASLMTSSAEPALANLKLLAAFPEWEVALPGGSRNSCTDVAALCRNEHGLCVIGVEAKVLEDFGPRLGEKRAAASEGQELRMRYLQDLLHVPHFDDRIRYQLLHRTASAVLTSRAFHAATAVMLVHAFGTPPDRQDDFSAFCAAVGAQEVVPNLFRVPSFTAPTLYLAWCVGDDRFLKVQLDNAVTA
jgi:hypothetical protein